MRKINKNNKKNRKCSLLEYPKIKKHFHPFTQEDILAEEELLIKDDET